MLDSTLCYNNTVLLLNMMFLNIQNDNFTQNTTLQYILTNFIHSNETIEFLNVMKGHLNELKSMLRFGNPEYMFDKIYTLSKDINLMLFECVVKYILIAFVCALLFGLFIISEEFVKLGKFVILSSLFCLICATPFIIMKHHEIKHHHPNYNCYNYNGQYLYFI